ncbi:MAG: septum formation protein Maf [Candidatus Omnitrophica bacterium]|nr:septum formation protein Maf [Candidatus Omnitrophota bacterium]
MIYLASTSPRRKSLLKAHGIQFRLLAPSYREKHLPRLAPARIVKIHAVEKGKSCARKIKNGIILAADTIVYLDGQVIGKPKNMKHARLMLEKLQGRWHTVYTGVAMFKIVSGQMTKKTVFVQKTKVLLKALTPNGIKNYFKKVNPLDKAGAYAIQSPHGGIIEKVKGLFSNAVGLPIETVLKKLRTF